MTSKGVCWYEVLDIIMSWLVDKLRLRYFKPTLRKRMMPVMIERSSITEILEGEREG